MDDNKDVQAQPVQQAHLEQAPDSREEDQDPNVFTTEQQKVVQALIDKAVADVHTKVRRDMTGLNRKNNDLQQVIKSRNADIQKLTNEKLSEEERWKIERERQKAEIDAERQELKATRNRAKAETYAVKNAIPVDLVDLVPMADESVMMESLERIKAVVDGERASAREAQKKEGGDRPGSSLSSGKSPKKKKSEMNAGEAQVFVSEHGIEAYRALPA